jgi:hypothetical protein
LSVAALRSVVALSKDRSENMAIPVRILVADGHTVYASVASCIPDDQHSPLVTTTPLGFVML